jgi:hypothetical protein
MVDIDEPHPPRRGVAEVVRDAIAELRTPMTPGHRQAAILAVAFAFVIVAYGGRHRVVPPASGAEVSANVQPASGRTTSTTVRAAAPALRPVATVPVATPAPLPVALAQTADVPPAPSPAPPPTTSTSTSTSTSTTTTTAPPPPCTVTNPLGGCLSTPATPSAR